MTDPTNPSLRDQAEALLALLDSQLPNPEPFDINHFVQCLLVHYGRIAAIWAVEDVQEIRPHLNGAQAREVLQQVGEDHDAELGISWTTLQTVADDIFPPARKSNEAEEA